MLKEDTLRTIEDLLDSSTIPMKEYDTILTKNNGDHTLVIRRHDDGPIIHMFLFSEIFNSYTTMWKCGIERNKLTMTIK